MADFRIYPAPGILSVTGSASMIGSGSVGATTIFSVDGNNGRLFEVTDDLSDSIFSANTIAGLPVIEAFANNCVVLGQFGGHQLRVTCTSIAGGKCSTASGTYSFVGGGYCNVANNNHSTVTGGCCNTASGYRSFIGGGYANRATDSQTTVSGGYNNLSYNVDASVGGGRNNCACGARSTIAGGFNNGAWGNCSFIGGGYRNWACSTAGFATIGGGLCNTVSSYSGYSIIGGGYSNTITGPYNFIGGGLNNNICCYAGYSSILAGGYNAIVSSCNTHVIGYCIYGSATNYTYVNNLCQVGGGISDRRTKNTICDTGYRLCDIVKLRPVSYCWNHDPTNSKKFGFIAQEVQEVIPDIVSYNEIEKVGPDGKRTIMGEGDPVLQFDREAIYASYVNGFKELKAENDALKAKIEAIEDILKRKSLNLI